MCGIVGYIADENVTGVIIEGLKKLEYRGYDSAGIALCSENNPLLVRKKKGRIANLEELIEDEHLFFHTGIGHTRWATHGEPSDRNAHPHTDMSGRIAVVHNGIIENYAELKEELIEKHGSVFQSDTDTEVAAHLIGTYYDGDLEDAVYQATRRMRGAYAFGVISADEPDKIVAARKDSPLIVGLGRKGNFIASDIPALLKYVRQIYLIENNELVVLKENEVKIYDADRNEVHRDVFNVTWDADAAEKEGYDHFMLKEIHEQPSGIRDTLIRRLDDEDEIVLDGIELTKEELEQFNRIYIVACGTAYHAGLIGKFAIEKLAKVPVEVDVASEFRYRDPFIDDHTLFIAISQSGETLDTLGALRMAKEKGARIMSVVNVVGSSIARESDDVFYTWAGPEIAVASTKAYTTQLICMYLIALYMGRKKEVISDKLYRLILEELKTMPEKLEAFLKETDRAETIADQMYQCDDAFFIGRGVDASVALEGSLKLKEISYINSFAIAAGELKHGTIALIDKGTPVVALATQKELLEKTVSNIQEVKARGAYVFAVAQEGSEEQLKDADEVILIPQCMDELAPILTIVPLQLLAYHIAKLRGCDIDKPKNLAKSVTVE